MKQKTEAQQKLVRELGLVGLFLQWMENHKKISDFILWLEIIALIWAVFTYNFTTNI